MIKKYLVRTRALMVATILAFTTMACGVVATEEAANKGAAQDAEREAEEESTLESTMNSSAFGASTASDKEETVYVMTDATGAANEVVVSEWLKNTEGTKELNDATDLSDVKNVKGDGTYTENADGTITWDTDGSDVYYQGKSDKAVPVEVKITYYLDGKEMSPEDIAGKSGKVTIRFDYKNNDVKTVTIGGEETQIYTPYAMISGAMLDTERFSNVEVTNGKVISEGNNYVVLGVALPGLKESLGIDDEDLDELTDKTGEDLDIPEYVEITADVTDFKLDMTMTYASGNALADLGFGDLTDSLDLDDAEEKVDELTDGTTQLVDGSDQLYDGTVELQDGTSQLYDGSIELLDGTKALANGVLELQGGTADLVEGTLKLKEGSAALRDGAYALKDGTSQLATGAGTLKDGTSQLASGAGSLKDGTSQLASGAGSLKDGTSQLASGAGDLKAGADQLSDGASSLSDGANTLNAGITSYTNGASDLATGIAQLDAGLKQLQQSVAGSAGSAANLTTLANSLGDAKSSVDNQLIAAIDAKLAAIAAQVGYEGTDYSNLSATLSGAAEQSKAAADQYFAGYCCPLSPNEG